MPDIQLYLNGLLQPIGVCGSAIDFSWKYAREDAAFVQKSYRIRIATSLISLQNGHADLWESGWIESSQNLYIPYTGTPLPPMQPIYWTVDLTSLDGAVFHAAPSSFAIAPDQWQAKWIWKDDSIVINDIARFRKTFPLSAPVQYGFLCVSAHNNCVVTVNGHQVTGYVSPAPSNPYCDKLFLSYDITACLTEGTNCINATVLYQGGHGQSYVDAHPGFWCECRFATNDDIGFVATNESWLCTPETPYEAAMPYQQRRCITAMEHYDARRCTNAPAWKPAVCVTPLCTDKSMHLQTIPEGEIERAITPKCLSVQDDVFVYDTGCLISGWVNLTLREKPGTQICIRYSENLNEEGLVGHNVANERSETYCDLYTMGPGPCEQWRPSFSYKAFRYFEITGCTQAIPVEDIRVEVAHTALPQTGSFSCDAPILNQIVEACLQTQKNNALGQLVDCPHREQAQYLADADLQAETLLYFFDAASLAEKVLADFSSAQYPDGTFPFSYPANTGLEKISLPIPEWDLYFCTLLWKLYRLTGKKAYLHQYFSPCCNMLNHYLSNRDPETGLVAKTPFRHISDHPFSMVDQSGKFLAVQNMKIYKDALLLADMADILQHEDMASDYRVQAQSLYCAIRRTLLDESVMLFRDSSDSAKHNRGINALALCYGLYQPEETSRVVAYLTEAPWDTSIVLTLDLLRALFLYGQQDQAYHILSRLEAPGWGAMVLKGDGTVWESFLDTASHCHAWSGYPARLLVEYLAGIRCSAPGFARISLKPWFPPDIHFIHAAVQTPQGPLDVHWHWDNTQTKLDISVPYGEHVDIYLPDRSGTYQKVHYCGAGSHSFLFPRT